MTLITSNFSLSIRTKSCSTVLILQFFNDAISTRQFPKTLKLLQAHAPNVLKTKCFNPLNLTFRKEVVNTELGHLFEHILLSYLCEEAISAGAKSALFDGVTLWNWKRYPKGNFKIVLAGKIDKAIFEAALLKSIRVTELLFSSHETDTVGILSTKRQQPLRRPLSQNPVLVS